ncbi:Deoxycytidine kinase 1, partial [Cryomyces antarcticus]
MPLWTQEAFVPDGDHVLTLYKYDEYTSSVISGKGAYLALPPWSAKKKDESVTGPLAALHLSTYLCSTRYSQDPNLLGLLKWRDHHGSDLQNLLKRFVFVPELEIVKLLNEVFDALFAVLDEYSGSEEYEDLIFNNLVIVLGIVHDRRFDLVPLVDHYIGAQFSWPGAASCLIRGYMRLLADPVNPEASRSLRATFKVGGQILKFIVSARYHQKEKEAGIGITSRGPAFVQELQKVFKALEALMRNPAPTL